MSCRSSRVRFPGSALAILCVLGYAGVAAAAGDVSVGSVTPGGDININGDTANNDITVTQNANGTVTITGNAGTTVNGAASHTTTAPVTGAVKIKTRGGDDKVTVDGVTKAGSSKGALNAQKQGLPTNNPGQRGVVVPELPNPAPKSKY